MSEHRLKFVVGLARNRRSRRLSSVSEYDTYRDAYMSARSLAKQTATMDFRSEIVGSLVLLTEYRDERRVGTWGFDCDGREKTLFLAN